MKYIFIDTETGGIEPAEADILQIAWDLTDDGFNSIHKASHYMRRTLPISETALGINGLTDDILEAYAGNPEKIYLDFFNDLSQADYLVAHHAPFDKRFIAKDARRRLKGIASSVAIEINYVIRTIDTIDTKKDFIFLNPIWKERRHPGPYLDEMCRFLSVPVHKMQFHNADGDVEAMRLCMLRIKELYPDTIPC